MSSPYVNTLKGRSGVGHLLKLASGYDMPQLGFGTYRIEANAIAPTLEVALGAGFRHIDCAPVYGNQQAVGDALHGAFKDKQRRITRDALFVTSKLWCTDQHPDRVEAACRRTLAELQLDYLDMYLMHWPLCWAHPKSGKYESKADWYPVHPNGCAVADPTVSIIDTWKAMEALVQKGLVRSIGLSNCDVDRVHTVLEAAEEPISTNQIERHPALPQHKLVSKHLAHFIATTAYCPLGPATRFTEPGFEGLYKHTFFKPVCDLTGFSAPRILLNWALDSGTALVVKAATPSHIKDNAKAHKGALDDTVRWMLNSYDDAMGTTRVMNPDNFLAAPGQRFFPPEKSLPEYPAER
jgi:alcohol dehydrogenase (NADP+)